MIVQKDETLETTTVESGIELTDETEYHEIVMCGRDVAM